MSDKVITRLYEIGLTQCRQIPQMFYIHEEKRIVLMAEEIVDDIKIARTDYHTSRFIKMFNESFKLGTVVQGPGMMRFFGINKEQADDFTIKPDVEDKFNGSSEYYLSRTRRKQFRKTMNLLDRNHFASINSSLAWI